MKAEFILRIVLLLAAVAALGGVGAVAQVARPAAPPAGPLAPPPAPAAAPAAAAAFAGQRWEYATFLQSQASCAWYGPDQHVVGKGGGNAALRDVYRQLGGRDVEGGLSLAGLFNLAGASVWDLAAVDAGAGGATYIFQRPAP